MAESSPVELGKLKPVKPAISPSQARAIRTGIDVISSVVGPGKFRKAAKAVELAKEARQIAEKAAGFSRPRLPVSTRETDYSPTPAKKIEAKVEEKRLKRGVEEPKHTPADSLAVQKAKAFGLGSVSPEARAAIEVQMNRGLRPDMGPLKFDPIPPAAVSIRPPRAPAMRKWTPETKRVTSKMPKPALPEVKILDFKPSKGVMAPKVARPKDEIPPIPKGAKDTEVTNSSGRLIFKATPEEMQNINEKLKNAKEAEEERLNIFTDTTARGSGTSVQRSPQGNRYWKVSEGD